jgi:hypothetical protein
MTQAITPTINPNTTSGTALASLIDDNTASYLSNHSGSVRPSYVVTGMLWLDNSNALQQVLNFFDGTDDIEMGTFDVTGNVFNVNGNFVPFTGGTLTGALKGVANTNPADLIRYDEAQALSGAVQTNLNSHTAASNPHGVTKATVLLGNADNTSDANKPTSIATQSQLDGKVAPSNYATDILGGTLKARYDSGTKTLYLTNNGADA